MIEVKIKKHFPDFLLDVAFSVDKEVLTLFGPSGSGKSMTFQCLSGLLKPDEGYINFNGRVVFDSKKGINILPRERKVGYIFQNYALFPHLTVRNNISFGMLGLNKNEENGKVNYLLKTMKLTGLGERYPWQLSGGQQQRVALARALAMEPELLLMDEPFSALDSNVKDELEREILEIQHYYQGNILLITHNLAEAYKLSSKIAVYQSGRIVQCESKEEVVINPVNKKAAALTGMKNFIEGQIEQIIDSKIVVKTPLGVIMVSFGNKGGLYEGKKVTLGIRPEFIIAGNGQAVNLLNCEITGIVEGISGYLCEFAPSCGEDKKYCFHVEMPKINAPVFMMGQKHSLYLPPERISIMTD